MREQPNNRLVQLDALRGIAALWVVLYHLTTRFSELYPQNTLTNFNLADGRHGVHLFFMISGFVILLTLDKCKTFKDFAAFRFYRLFPTYWIAAIITFLIISYFGLPGREVSIKDALLNLTMIPEALGAKLIDNCYWSLQVELFFYVLMGTLVFAGFRKNLVLILACLVAFDVVLLLAWAAPSITLPKPIKAIRLLLGLRYLHLFLFGIICYERRKNNHWFHLPLLFGLVLVSCVDNDLEHFGFIAFVASLFFLATNWEAKILQNKVILFFGGISYPLYLVHQNIGYVIIRQVLSYKLQHLFGVGIAFVFAISLATLLSLIIERRFSGWLRRIYKEKFSKI